jgi:hypothetical protein
VKILCGAYGGISKSNEPKPDIILFVLKLRYCLHVWSVRSVMSKFYGNLSSSLFLTAIESGPPLSFF